MLTQTDREIILSLKEVLAFMRAEDERPPLSPEEILRLLPTYEKLSMLLPSKTRKPFLEEAVRLKVKSLRAVRAKGDS